ncbi:MAG: hypothetical protein OHK0032_19110 [Thermodesulfovibrionales bacterium]
MTRREVFEEIGGFNEAFAVTFNDVDFCLRIREKGYKIVWTPYAELYHHEGVSRGKDTIEDPKFKKEIDMIKRWGHILYSDPAYNPNLTLDREDFSLAFPPRVKKPWEEILEMKKWGSGLAISFLIMPIIRNNLVMVQRST